MTEQSLVKYMNKMSRIEMINHLEKIKEWQPITDIYIRMREVMIYTARDVIQNEAKQ